MNNIIKSSILFTTFIVFISGCSNKKDYCVEYKDAVNKYNFIDSINCIDEIGIEAEIKLYLSFQYTDPEWEDLFCNAFANEIYKSNFELKQVYLFISYPKVKRSVYNAHLIQFPEQIIRMDKLDFENYLVNEFTPSDFYTYSTYLRRLFDYYDDSRFNELFGSLIMNLFMSKKLNSNDDDRTFVLDELIEIIKLHPKEDPSKLIELKSKLDTM